MVGTRGTRGMFIGFRGILKNEHSGEYQKLDIPGNAKNMAFRGIPKNKHSGEYLSDIRLENLVAN